MAFVDVGDRKLATLPAQREGLYFIKHKALT